MKMKDAMNEIYNKPKGYMISFEWCGDGFLRGDYFPDKHDGEELIQTEREAWDLAYRFAIATKGRTCNLYVIDHNFKPVDGYKKRYIKNRY